jgi:hypothetical protein
MKMKTVCLVVMIPALVASLAAADADKQDLKEAARAVTEAFEGHSFTAKVNLRRYGHHFVTPSGEPHPSKGKKQGRGGEGSIQLDSGVKVRAGEVGHTIAVMVKGKEQVLVLFNRKPHAKLNPATIHVLYDRQVTVDDLTPEKMALAVESLVEIEGYEPGAAVAAAFDQVLDSGEEPAGADAPAPMATAPTVVSLRARSEPSSARAGEEVALVLEYEVAAPSGPVTATETRSLSLDGRMMPTYPVSERVERRGGVFVSTYRQPLPRTAAPGTYAFEGEVCVAGDCISRTVTFEVSPP